MPPYLRIDGTAFRDNKNREITLHGVNLSGDSKLPRHPDIPSHVSSEFFDGDNVSFVGRPFSLEEAGAHFGRLRRWGYNTLRYLFTWEAIEHSGPGKYDEDFIQFTIDVLRKAKSFGFYVFMDPHQDVWSRFTGGSGAPMWTVYACGLDPKAFTVTEAALVQNTHPDPKRFPKMIWATNYTRLACQTIFTMFFAGRKFTPKAVIDGKNIQDYLQDHFISAYKHLANRVYEAGDLDAEAIIGWESMNEPNRGLIGYQDISVVPSTQKLQKGTSPTAWQAILTGSGRACEVETWDFGGMGPYKSGSKLIDPKGRQAWLSTDEHDKHYGWDRDDRWKLGKCVWAQHGLWDPSNDALLKKDYFARDPDTGETIDYDYFTDHYFMDFYRKIASEIREVFPNTIMFCQGPTNEVPPAIKGTRDDEPNMVYSVHYYDGVTLLNKHWNRLWNVDWFGILRGRYLAPAFAIKVGESAIRNCFRDTLLAMRKEGLDNMGPHPCVFTEIGIPFDMDDDHAYKTGDYSSQLAAMDANFYALESTRAHFTLWTYTATNDHAWGDQWNGEDLSIFSVDDKVVPSSGMLHATSSVSSDLASPSYSESQTSETMKRQRMVVQSQRKSSADNGQKEMYRAAQAYVRPTPVYTHGDLISFGYDMRKCEFKLKLASPTSTAQDAPTQIFLPSHAFPSGQIEVEVSGGRWAITEEQLEEGGSVSHLKWYHAEGEQKIRVKGTPALANGATQDEVGYIEQLRNCTIM